jgi:hypothetical protein
VEKRSNFEKTYLQNFKDPTGDVVEKATGEERGMVGVGEILLLCFLEDQG